MAVPISRTQINPLRVNVFMSPVSGFSSFL